MKWKFWRSDPSSQASPNNVKPPKSSRPRSLPQQIGQHLVLREKMDPDWVWNLKCVLSPRDRKNRYDFRVYNPTAVYEAQVIVRYYATLDTHPDLILFHGWYDKITNEIELLKGAPDKAA